MYECVGGAPVESDHGDDHLPPVGGADVADPQGSADLDVLVPAKFLKVNMLFAQYHDSGGLSISNIVSVVLPRRGITGVHLYGVQNPKNQFCVDGDCFSTVLFCHGNLKYIPLKLLVVSDI